MRFSNIKQFIHSGSYEIDVFLGDLESTLGKWEKTYGLELNPDFQRGNVWTEEQQIAYVEFLLSGGITSKVIYFNSPAFGNDRSIIGNLSDTLLCVDGLQRLTACLRFIKDEIKVFGYFYSEYEDTPRMRQGLKFNVNCLNTKADILRWYLEFNTGGTIHSKEEIERVRLMLKDEELKV